MNIKFVLRDLYASVIRNGLSSDKSALLTYEEVPLFFLKRENRDEKDI